MGISFVEVVILIVMMVASLAAWMFLSSWMIKRNFPKVLDIFHKKNAIGIKNAKTVQELGLQPQSLTQRLLSRRDYKPKALEMLMQLQVVLMTDEGKLYVTEQSIAAATWLKYKRKITVSSQ